MYYVVKREDDLNELAVVYARGFIPKNMVGLSPKGLDGKQATDIYYVTGSDIPFTVDELRKTEFYDNRSQEEIDRRAANQAKRALAKQLFQELQDVDVDNDITNVATVKVFLKRIRRLMLEVLRNA